MIALNFTNVMCIFVYINRFISYPYFLFLHKYYIFISSSSILRVWCPVMYDPVILLNPVLIIKAEITHTLHNIADILHGTIANDHRKWL